MKMIHTREQLIHEIKKVFYKHFDDKLEYDDAANEIADLIANLD